MFHKFIPSWHLIIEVFLINICYGTQFKKKPITVRRSVIEGLGAPSCNARTGLRISRKPAKSIHQTKCAVMVPIITDEHIRRRCLRWWCFQRWVCFHHSHYRLKSRIRHTVLPNTAIVIFKVVYKPFNSVIIICTLIGSIFRSVRSHHYELSFGAILSTYILKHKDKSILIKQSWRTKLLSVII